MRKAESPITLIVGNIPLKSLALNFTVTLRIAKFHSDFYLKHKQQKSRLPFENIVLSSMDLTVYCFTLH